MAHDIHAHRILILDFGSQYTQLIARRVREIGVYCEIHPFDMDNEAIRAFAPRGIILAGGPESVHEANSPRAPQAVFDLNVPILGICYGMQTMAEQLGADGIRVNAVLPGLVAGERQRRVLQSRADARGIGFEQAESEAFSHTSIKEYVTPQQIADQILYLASPRARTISGQAISICGDTGMLG